MLGMLDAQIGFQVNVTSTDSFLLILKRFLSTMKGTHSTQAVSECSIRCRGRIVFRLYGTCQVSADVGG